MVKENRLIPLFLVLVDYIDSPHTKEHLAGHREGATSPATTS